MPNWVQWVSLILAIIGTFSGIYALILNHQRTKIINRQEKERLAKKKKANFSVSTFKEPRGHASQRMLKLKNVGYSDARNVSIKFFNNTKEISPPPSKIPNIINSNQTVETPLKFGGHDITLEVVITWEDDFNISNELRETVS